MHDWDQFDQEAYNLKYSDDGELLDPEAHRKAVAARLRELSSQLIFGFYEDAFPAYSQGPQQSEIQSLATADEINALVRKIEGLKK